MNTIKMRDLEIGSGCPKIIVPIIEKDLNGIRAKARELTGYSMDMVEWRADHFENVFDTAKVLQAAAALREELKNTPILFTFRTRKEGGEKEIDMNSYTALNKAVAESGYVDAVDVEIFSGDAVVRENIKNIHSAGRIVVGSNHDFFKTPSKDDLLYRLRKMQDMGADLPKIAVMPQSAVDVAVLQQAAAEMAQFYANRPIIAMSMGSMGVATRIAGEAFGSTMTFGAVGRVSAPGQIPLEQLQTAMKILHNSL